MNVTRIISVLWLALASVFLIASDKQSKNLDTHRIMEPEGPFLLVSPVIWNAVCRLAGGSVFRDQKCQGNSWPLCFFQVFMDS